MRKGYIAAFAAYFWWGLSPLYWKLISAIPALEILGARVLLSLPILVLILLVKKNFSTFRSDLKSFSKIKPYILSAFLLSVNWYIFIWAMNNQHVVEVSLGYFINPLVNVLMGVVLLGEKMRRLHWVAVSLAFAGVLYLIFAYGEFPWVALILAGSFAGYGFIRKTASMGALNGLAAEMLFLFIPATLLLFFLSTNAHFVIPTLSYEMYFLLSLTAFVTIVPLLVFAYAARKIPYSTLGLIQYIAPSIQFLLGVFLYNEDFSQERFIGFSFIWLALIIYATENIYVLKQKTTI